MTASHKSVVKVAIPHCRGRWFPTTATRTGRDGLRIGCKKSAGCFPYAGGRGSCRISVFGCELTVMFDVDMTGS